MSRRSEWFLAAGLSAFVACLTLIPYLVAADLPHPGMEFAGLLINPLDGFSYLAKMRQGADGGWLFRLPYASDPGPGVLLFQYHLLLGRLSQLLGLNLLSAYHSARLVSSFLMYLCGFMLLGRLLQDLRTRWAAFLLTLFGSGLGWVGFLLGRMPSDLTIPESVPFFSSLANAHFPLATALMLGAVATILKPPRNVAAGAAIALVLGLLLGAVQPFAVIGLSIPLAAWWIWEVGRNPEGVLKAIRAEAGDRALRLAAFAFGGGIWLVYDYWILRTHPVLKAWTAQNLTLSPPLVDYGLGYAVLLLPAVIGLLRARPQVSPEGRLLLLWAGLGALLLYAPVAFQRRMALGLFYPLAALAALGLAQLAGSARRFALVVLMMLLVGLPSNLLVAIAGPAQVARGDPQLVVSEADLEAYRWIKQNVEPGDLILAAPYTGNRLPAYADVRVLYGHPFETPNAERARAEVEAAFSGSMRSADGLRWLAKNGVGYVFYGPLERALGTPEWLSELAVAFSRDGTVIYRVGTP